MAKRTKRRNTNRRVSKKNNRTKRRKKTRRARRTRRKMRGGGFSEDVQILFKEYGGLSKTQRAERFRKLGKDYPMKTVILNDAMNKAATALHAGKMAEEELADFFLGELKDK
jgi:hypothetical protein